MSIIKNLLNQSMRILYLTPSHIDYLSDQLYFGLCRQLGWESIIDYPYKEIYHEPSKKVPSLPQNPGQRFQESDIMSDLNDHKFDLVILSAIRREPLEALDTFKRHCILPPLILVDGDDGVEINTELFEKHQFSLYFKREYLATNNQRLEHFYNRWKAYGMRKNISDRTFPLPFSIILESIPQHKDQKPDIDISFIGIASHRNRIRAVNILHEAKDLNFEGKVFAESITRKSKLVMGTFEILKAKLQGDPYPTKDEQAGILSRPDYFQLLRRSQMGLSIRGAGFDTVRYWEIVAAKRVLVSEEPYIHIPHNFENGKHALFCKPDLSDLATIVRRHARDQSFCETMVKAAYNHLLQYHTCAERAKQFLTICEERL